MSNSSNKDNLFEDRFLILGELGSGGMGKVYRAKQLDSDRPVALKFLLGEKVESAEAVARFNREFKLLARLSHPHIMTVYGMALDKSGNPYAVCELLEGETLLEVLKREGKMPWERAVKIILQVSQAIQYMHEQEILHRDLKPANVMLLEKPEPDFVKVLDFGLSRVLHDDTDLAKITMTGNALGTAFYSSPEQSMRKADKRSDVYSLACILFELLAGECLFPADSPASAMYRHSIDDPISRFEAIHAKVPHKLLTVLAESLCKDPEQRIQSMLQMSNLLEQILDEPGELIESGSFQNHTQFQGLTALVVAVSLLLVAAATFVFLKINRSETFSSPGAARISRGDPSKNSLHNGIGAYTLEEQKHPDRLVASYMEQGKLVLAEDLQKRILAAKERAPGKNSSELLDALRVLSQIHYFQDRYSEGDEQLRRSIAINQKLHGANCLEQIQDLESLAEHLVEKRKPAEAEKLLKQALKIIEMENGSGKAAVIERLGIVYEAERKYAEAIPLLLSSLEVNEKKGEDSRAAVTTIEHLANCYDRVGKLQKAEALWKRLLLSYEKRAVNYPDLVSALESPATLSANRLGKTDSVAKVNPTRFHELMVGTLLKLAENLKAQHKYSEAAPNYEKAFSILEKSLAPEDKRLADIHNRLVECSKAKPKESPLEPAR